MMTMTDDKVVAVCWMNTKFGALCVFVVTGESEVLNDDDKTNKLTLTDSADCGR